MELLKASPIEQPVSKSPPLILAPAQGRDLPPCPRARPGPRSSPLSSRPFRAAIFLPVLAPVQGRDLPPYLGVLGEPQVAFWKGGVGDVYIAGERKPLARPKGFPPQSYIRNASPRYTSRAISDSRIKSLSPSATISPLLMMQARSVISRVSRTLWSVIKTPIP